MITLSRIIRALSVSFLTIFCLLDTSFGQSAPVYEIQDLSPGTVSNPNLSFYCKLDQYEADA